MRTPWAGALSLLLSVFALPFCLAEGETCGDPPFEDCGEGEFCHALGGLCAAPYPYGICLKVPSICPAHWDPVCGCDRQIYPNECFARMARVPVARLDGSCPPVCAPGVPCDTGDVCYTPAGQCSTNGSCISWWLDCPDTCSPVCGCDGVTYRNSCLAHVLGTTVEYYGACEHPEHLMIDDVEGRADGGLAWQAHPDATAYHVYREVVVAGPATGATYCYASSLEQNALPPGEDPEPGDLWLLLVSGVFESGEGPLGLGPGCAPRQTEQPCDGS
jgi:hypothetical protein